MLLLKVLLGVLICFGVIPQTISQPVKHSSFHRLRRRYHHHTQHHLDINGLSYPVNPQPPPHGGDQPISGNADDGPKVGINLDSDVR